MGDADKTRAELIEDVQVLRDCTAELKRLAKFAEADPNPVLMVEYDGTILYANPASDPLLKVFTSHVGGRLPGHWQEQIARALRQGATGEVEMACGERAFSLICVPAAGRGHVSLYGREITRQRALERQMHQTARLEAIGRLAGGVAHDFGNIITGITGYAQFLLDQAETGSQTSRDLSEIRALADRAGDLTRQLLAFSRRRPTNAVVLNLNALIETTASLLTRVIGEDIDLRLRPAPDLGNGRADPAEIEQVLINLAINARDAMPQGGTLTIETANVTLEDEHAARHLGVAPGPYVLLALTDTGCGMDEKTRRRIFEPFFTTKAVGKGTGLGLATADGIVKQYHGAIRAYSEPGRGTTIKVYLPRAEAGVQTLERAASAEATFRGRETILVVEDEQTVRDLAQRILEGAGYTVLTAASASEAEAAFERGNATPIDLLLTDVVLPTRSGCELYQRLASHHPGAKVLYMSGYGAGAVFNHGILPSGTAFLQKPFSPRDLGKKVREVLDGRSAVVLPSA